MRHRAALTCRKGIVIKTSSALSLPITLDPLQELQVVLVLRPDQLIDVDISLNSIPLEGCLQNLVVRNKLVLALGHPVDLPHGDSARVASIDDLAIDGARSALLDFVDVHL